MSPCVKNIDNKNLWILNLKCWGNLCVTSLVYNIQLFPDIPMSWDICLWISLPVVITSVAAFAANKVFHSFCFLLSVLCPMFLFCLCSVTFLPPVCSVFESDSMMSRLTSLLVVDFGGGLPWSIQQFKVYSCQGLTHIKPLLLFTVSNDWSIGVYR